MALTKPFAGQATLKHFACYIDEGTIGAGFDPHDPKTPTKSIKDLTEAGQAAYITLAGEIGELFGVGKADDNEVDLIAKCEAVLVAKESLCEATIGK